MSEKKERLEFSRINAVHDLLINNIRNIVPNRYDYERALKNNAEKQLESDEQYIEWQKEAEELYKKSQEYMSKRSDLLSLMNELKNKIKFDNGTQQEVDSFGDDCDKAHKEITKLREEFKKEIIFTKDVDGLQLIYDNYLAKILSVAEPLRKRWNAVKENND